MLETCPYRFPAIWLTDFEFQQPEGERPNPVCMVAHELLGGRRIRVWRDDLLKLRRAPFSTGPEALFIAYYASAELGCFLSLGWEFPTRILDLFVEHRWLTNGLSLPHKVPIDNSLVGALATYGLDALDAGRKAEVRKLVMRREDWSSTEQADILDYCADDVVAMERLLGRLHGIIDWPRALLRGRYMAAAARMEYAGVPIDLSLWRRLAAHWEPLKAKLIDTVDRDYGIYEDGVFKTENFNAWRARLGIPWPVYPSGAPHLDAETFRDQSLAYPAVAPLHQLRQTISKLRLIGLSIGRDSRNRCLLSAFRSTSGRNQPSNSKFVFGPATWMRGLVRPPEGYGLAYIDWSAQEIAVAAALSGDQAMIDGYASGDPHWAFAQMAGLAPAGSSRQDHPILRARCKTVNLGVNYGMTEIGLALRLGVDPAEAREMLRLHRSTFHRFWEWSEQVVFTGMLRSELYSVFGWRLLIDADVNPRTLMNFPMQANGAEMMRLAAIAATDDGIEVCCPVHDAFVIAAPLDRLEGDVAAMRDFMRRAGIAVTGGLEVRTDATVIRFPDRYMDERGVDMWGRVMALLETHE
jgi:hypothetical protein